MWRLLLAIFCVNFAAVYSLTVKSSTKSSSADGIKLNSEDSMPTDFLELNSQQKRLAYFDMATKKSSKFLVISGVNQVGYVPLVRDEFGDLKAPSTGVHPLITHDIGEPRGLAVCGQYLYVAVPSKESVYQFKLQSHNGHLLTVAFRGSNYRATVAEGVTATFVACNNGKNQGLFFSDTKTNTIQKVDQKLLENVGLEQSATGVIPKSEVIHSTSSLVPTAVATDALNVFWAERNGAKDRGQLSRKKSVGASVKEVQHANESVMKKSDGDVGNIVPNGLCTSPQTTFFTTKNAMYGLKKTSSKVTAVPQVMFNLANPQGCAWDKDGTMFFVEADLGRIRTFASSTEHVTKPKGFMEETGGLLEPFDVAVFVQP